MPTPSGRGSFPQRAAGGALRRLIVLAVVCASAPAIAAPCSRADCENLAGVLHRTEVPVNQLTFRIVDLGDPERADAPVGPNGLTESMAPLLFLTPRVTSILEDVFNDESDALRIAAEKDQDVPPAIEAPAVIEESDEGPTSPVAGTETRTGVPDRYGLSLDGASVMPKFQRQMYRTDI